MVESLSQPQKKEIIEATKAWLTDRLQDKYKKENLPMPQNNEDVNPQILGIVCTESVKKVGVSTHKLQHIYHLKDENFSFLNNLEFSNLSNKIIGKKEQANNLTEEQQALLKRLREKLEERSRRLTPQRARELILSSLGISGPKLNTLFAGNADPWTWMQLARNIHRLDKSLSMRADESSPDLVAELQTPRLTEPREAPKQRPKKNKINPDRMLLKSGKSPPYSPVWKKEPDVEALDKIQKRAKELNEKAASLIFSFTGNDDDFDLIYDFDDALKAIAGTIPELTAGFKSVYDAATRLNNLYNALRYIEAPVPDDAVLQEIHGQIQILQQELANYLPPEIVKEFLEKAKLDMPNTRKR